MVESKEWNWEAAEKDTWLIPSEESYYYAHKWKEEGRKRLLDLGCGLGRHAIFFDSQGFRVTACDLSEYSVKHLRGWQKEKGVDFRTLVCDMKSLPFADNAFDCIYSYHVLSHTDSEGIKQILSEIRRVLRPGGEIFFDLCSKDSWSFKESGFPRIDPDTIIFQGGVEDGIPHYFVDADDIKRITSGFGLRRIRHINDMMTPLYNGGGTHYFIEMRAEKEYKAPDYSGIIGKTVSGITDRPKGSTHPRIPSLVYPINYGYVSGVMAGDGAEQDVYIFGTDEPLREFEGKVIAVWHRYNDLEDKWIVSCDGRDHSDEEILAMTEFQEKFFDGELFR